MYILYTTLRLLTCHFESLQLHSGLWVPYGMELKVRLFSKYKTFLENLIHDLDIVLHESYHGCNFLAPH
jgi:hypothetical protein